MGGVLSSKPMLLINPNVDRRPFHSFPQSTSQLLMYQDWKANDLVYEYVVLKREKLEDKETGIALRIVAMFSPCKVSYCNCKGGTFRGAKRNTFGWTNSNCAKSGCNHPMSDHVQHLVCASRIEYVNLIKLIFDIINIKESLEKSSIKPKLERNIFLEDIFESVYKVLIKTVHLDPFTTPNIDTIFGNPPFESTNINQILLNFSMHIFGDSKVLKLKTALKLTKFVVRMFDTWMWNIKKEKQQSFDFLDYSKSYDYYFCRFLVCCAIPRCVHSIPIRYSPSKIFGRDVLKYTMEAFRIELLVWCYKQNIMWTEHTKLYCCEYLPIYMDSLLKEVLNNESKMWNVNYQLSDIKKRTISLENS